MGYSVVVDKAGVLRLAKDLLEGCSNLNKFAVDAKDSVDMLSLTFQDEQFAKVEYAIEMAIDGYKKMEQSILSAAEGLEEYSSAL